MNHRGGEREECGVGDNLIEVPLFPLNFVLFPGMAVPIHIFEPRYQEMLATCLDTNTPFGIVLARPEGAYKREIPARVGTLAQISDYHRLPDGRYNLLAVGADRFKVVQLRSDHPYLTGLVRVCAESKDTTALTPRLIANAHHALSEYLAHILALVESDESEIAIPDDPIELSYLIGMCLTCEDCDKQELLELDDVADRLERGAQMLRAEMASFADETNALDDSTKSTRERFHLN